MSKRKTSMPTTRELIEAALAAQEAFDTATATLAGATAAVAQAKTELTAANLSVHNDLVAGGPCCIIDESTDPPTVTMYTAAEPDSFTATPIRVAA
jgi:hypothetical protein